VELDSHVLTDSPLVRLITPASARHAIFSLCAIISHAPRNQISRCSSGWDVQRQSIVAFEHPRGTRSGEEAEQMTRIGSLIIGILPSCPRHA